MCLVLSASRAESATIAVTDEEERQLTGTLPDIEGAVHGFPALYDQQGRKLADGEFTQWLEGDLLYSTNLSEFDVAHRIVETFVLRVQPRLIQESWSWSETNNEELVRSFVVDFATGHATVAKREGDEIKRWSADLKIHPGRTFAGAAFVTVLKSLRARLCQDEKIELEAVGFMPKPRVVSVELSFASRDQVAMVGRIVPGDRFVIHPQVPAIAKLFVDVADTRIWLTASRPAGFLRWEGALVEVGDPIVRSDLLPGTTSRPAEPVP
jgi:hypothetical protein